MELGLMLRLSCLLMLVLMSNECYGCGEQERIALLQLKASINHPNGTDSLPSWKVEEEGTSDCCEWERIECNNMTRRVIKLLLNETMLGDWNEYRYLNASMFLPFESLRSLDLSGNYLHGCVENEGFEKLLRLSNLEVLLLNNNYFNNNILSSLNRLSNLVTLDLSENNLNGPIRIQDLDGFNNLKELDMSLNRLNSIITNRRGLKIASRLNNLEVLDLSFNDFNSSGIWSFLGGLSSLKRIYLMGNRINGTIHSQDIQSLRNMEILFLERAALNDDFLPSITRVMTSLKVLSLQYCGLTGTLPVQGLCELRRLEELDLRNNRLEGNLPWCLANLTSLRVMDLSLNQFTGNVALSPLADLKSLEYLVLSGNRFQIPVSFRSFFNHSKLKFFESFNNELLVDTDVGTHLVPSFQLIGFRLSDGGFGNVVSGASTIAFPNFLYYQKNLQIVALSRLNFFNQKFPYWLLDNNTRLATLLLPDNSFTGPLYLPSHLQYPELLALDISKNHLYGHIPHHIATAFPGLKFLDMSANGFGGGIPSSLGDLSSLEYLDLSSNHLSGEIPGQLAMGCSALELLKLSNNNLQGPALPILYNNWTRLEVLYLDHNHFTKIPDSLSNCSDLKAFNISHNHLLGEIPGSWMGSILQLREIDMSKNHLEGPIPSEFCQLQLSHLDLSENNITGTIPSCFNQSGIEHVFLSNNRLQGPLSSAFYNCTSLVILDLSHNQLTGPIPKWIGTLLSLSVLLLKNNTFEGEIPLHLCNLSYLSMIDLSFNNFSGLIPPCLSSITFQGELNSKSAQGVLDVSTPYLSFRSFLGDLKLTSKRWKDTFLGDEDYNFVDRETEVEFTTKGMSLSYKGIDLDLFSGIDLSCNKLTGQIPHEVGNIGQIRVLNLSHNGLSGTIPTTLSNIHNLESLDLSFNNLSGKIPSQLAELNYLAKFNVSYNNLSGSIPQSQTSVQFDTFDGSCYIGNPLLCGPPVSRTCTAIEPPLSTPRLMNSIEEGDNVFMDMESFYVSFTVSYITMLLGIVVIFYINPYWRRAWIHLVEVCVTSCYYFVVNNFQKVFYHGNK